MAPKMAVWVKLAPCSTAKNVKITPEVKGKPDNKPPQNVPHFFAAMETPSINTGVRMSLMRKVFEANIVDIVSDKNMGKLSVQGLIILKLYMLMTRVIFM